MRSPLPIALLTCSMALVIGASCILDRAGGLDPDVEGAGASGAGGGGTGGSTPECTDVSDCGAITDCTTGWECTDNICVPTLAPPGHPCTGTLDEHQVCDGSGTCVQCNVNGDCAAGTCSPNLEEQVGGAQCVDEVCMHVGETTDCDPYFCSEGSCLGMCRNNGDCIDPEDVCDLGECGPLRPLGAPCDNSQACDSTYCADGVCCSEECGTQCEGCSMALTGQPDGTCDSILHGMDDPDMSCSFGFGCEGNGTCIDCDEPTTEPVSAGCPMVCNGGCGGSGIDCNIVCDMASPCTGQITCPNGKNCKVSCAADNACSGATFACPPGRTCDVTCENNVGSCANATVNCGDGPCSMNCKNTTNGNCTGATIDCGTNYCDVKCSAPNEPATTGVNANCSSIESACTN